MAPGFADQFAREWMEAWNAHDLDRVLSHYEEDFELSSPIVRSLLGEPSGTLKGKPAVRAYWTRALELIPALRFELVEVMAGVDSLVICYNGHRGPVAEVFHLSANGKVARASAHYAESDV